MTANILQVWRPSSTSFAPRSMRVNDKWSAPAMAVDPVTQTIVVVYADQPGTNSTVEYITCPPAFSGPCTAPMAINDVSDGQRVFPAVAVDNLGNM